MDGRVSGRDRPATPSGPLCDKETSRPTTPLSSAPRHSLLQWSLPHWSLGDPNDLTSLETNLCPWHCPYRFNPRPCQLICLSTSPS